MTAIFFPEAADDFFLGPAAAFSAEVLCAAGRLASNLPFFLIRIPPIQAPQGDIIFFVSVLYIKRRFFATAFPTGTGPGILNFLLIISPFGRLRTHGGIGPHELRGELQRMLNLVLAFAQQHAAA